MNMVAYFQVKIGNLQFVLGEVIFSSLLTTSLSPSTLGLVNSTTLNGNAGLTAVVTVFVIIVVALVVVAIVVIVTRKVKKPDCKKRELFRLNKLHVETFQVFFLCRKMVYQTVLL